MAQDEFSIIEQYFTHLGSSDGNTLLGIGDDAAVVQVADDRQLVVSMDTLISGVHFDVDTGPADIAYKALAVNLSDLAAMAAEPAWFLLSLTLPEPDAEWLTDFAERLRQTADTFGLQLIGGDTCRGPLSITIQIGGTVPRDRYVRRSGAEPGDLVLVSGEIGNAALGLANLQGRVDLPPDLRDRCERALKLPRPRLELAPFLRQFAGAAVDVSDGLVADLGHILKASGCGASIWRERLPVNDWIVDQQAYDYALGGGDDYEICCSVPVRFESEIRDWNQAHPDCRLTVIGNITDSGYCLHQDGGVTELGDSAGYRHFG